MNWTLAYDIGIDETRFPFSFPWCDDLYWLIDRARSALWAHCEEAQSVLCELTPTWWRDDVILPLAGCLPTLP